MSLDVPHINHDLAIALLDIHLVYRGSCKFNLLCRNTLLKTIGRRLLLYKTARDLPKVMVKLYRVDLWNSLAKSLLSEDTSKPETSHGETTDSEMTEIYEYCENKQKTSESIMKQKNVDKNNNNVIQENINEGLDTYMQQEHTDSDSTVIYENQEKEIGTIYFFQRETNIKDHHKHQSLPHLLYLKCPQTNCKFRSNKRKVTNKHYRLEHKKINKCKYCKKSYSPPHSLNQHIYTHNKDIKGYLCNRCGNIYPFHSQLLTHKIKHTRRYKEECTECSLTFKYRHDMLKHCREHFAKEFKCEKCEYTGTLLKLKSHKNNMTLLMY